MRTVESQVMVELIFRDVLPSCYFGMCQTKMYTHVSSCVEYLLPSYLCVSRVNQSELAEVAVTPHCVLNTV